MSLRIPFQRPESNPSVLFWMHLLKLSGNSVVGNLPLPTGTTHAAMSYSITRGSFRGPNTHSAGAVCIVGIAGIATIAGDAKNRCGADADDNVSAMATIIREDMPKGGTAYSLRGHLRELAGLRSRPTIGQYSGWNGKRNGMSQLLFRSTFRDDESPRTRPDKTTGKHR